MLENRRDLQHAPRMRSQSRQPHDDRVLDRSGNGQVIERFPLPDVPGLEDVTGRDERSEDFLHEKRVAAGECVQGMRERWTGSLLQPEVRPDECRGFRKRQGFQLQTRRQAGSMQRRKRMPDPWRRISGTDCPQAGTSHSRLCFENHRVPRSA